MKNFRILAVGLLFVLCGSHRPQLAASLSLSFEENRGQAPLETKFLARGHGYNVLLTPEGNDLLLRHHGRSLSVHTRLMNVDSRTVLSGEEKQLGKVHYFRRNGSLKDIPTYARVRYGHVYPGIDLIYYGNEQQLEYDFVVSPGADPKAIALRFEGMDQLTIDKDGNLVLHINDSQIIQRRPIVYERRRDVRKDVEGSYRLLTPNTVGFEIGPYDRNATLVIDPILTYSTFLGGTNGDDDARAVATDSAGNLYVTGSTTSTNFQTALALQPNAANQDPTAGTSDAFVTKLNPAGTALVYSTYFGGIGDDDANSIAVDSSGNVIIVGATTSTDFPTTDGAVRRTCNTGPSGCLDAFVASFTSNGASAIYSTYLGGTGDDEARGVALDAAGNAYITGRTDSSDFPLTLNAYSTDPSTGAFVTKLTANGSIVYSTYFATIFGPTAEPKAIAVDSNGSAYITGSFTVPGGSTGADVFITKLNVFGTGIIYTQTIRGAKDDVGNAIVVDPTGAVYVAGETTSINFPATSGAVQSTFGGGPAFRTLNAGSNWAASSSGINRTSLYALAVAPGTPSTIYVGADDETVGGVFKSTNGGDTWASSSSGIFDARVHALAIDPSTPATLYAGTRTLGVYKSTNGGAAWTGTSLNNVFVTALAIDTTATTTIYAGTDANGIYKTTNGGTSWSVINNGLPASAVRAIVTDPTSSTIVYAATSVGVYKSTNGGSSWTASSSGLFDVNVNALVIDPRNPAVLLAGTSTVGVFRSATSGGLWVPANGGLTGSGTVLSVTAIAIDPTSGTFYAAAGEADAVKVYKSSNGTAWTATSLATARLTGFGVDKNNSNTVYAATVGGSDAFIAKWNPSGSLVYATYLGGFRDDTANAIAVDSTGAMYVAGSTSSTNFPLVSPVQSSFGGGSGVTTDAFAAKLSATGTELKYSTYLGGSNNDFGKGIAVDSSLATYIVGVTASADFKTTAALIGTRPGLLDAFIVKLGEGSAVSYAVPPRGGFSVTSQGAASTTSVGFGRIQSNGNTPAGLAIFSFRQNNVLVSEAAVPSTSAITMGRIYAEVSGNVDTGVAIANPNASAATVTYYFTDRNGQNFGQGSVTIPANGQTAKFLDQSPFNGAAPIFGTFTFSSTQPVAVIALRGLTNERGEFLITTLPVSDLSALPDTNPILFPHFADGGGWRTQILLVNSTDASMAGSVQFGGSPAQDYAIAPRSAVNVATPGTDPSVTIGLVRVTPSSGNAPTGVAVFSFRNAGVTVTEAGVQALRPGNAFRLYAESSGVTQQNGSIQTGIALANPSSSSALVTFELTTITGVSTGLNGSIVLPGNGQAAMFLRQIPGFTLLPDPFQGVLRVSTVSPAGMSVVGLRGRYNERGDFLITTTQPTNESTPASSVEQFFPHFADGGGYTTQFILYNGSTDQSSSGLIRFFSPSGETLSLDVR